MWVVDLPSMLIFYGDVRFLSIQIMFRHNRAFACTFLLRTFMLLVSSATDAESASSESKAVASVETAQKTQNGQDKAHGEKKVSNCNDDSNSTNCVEQSAVPFVSRIWDTVSGHRGWLFAGLTVVAGIAVFLCIVRAVRLHRRRTKSRKYGVIATQGDMEMEPLSDSDEEDGELTVFEVNGKSK